jgi:poly-beta-1,6-N-acetyl-D-glucosamine synthase
MNTLFSILQSVIFFFVIMTVLKNIGFYFLNPIYPIIERIRKQKARKLRIKKGFHPNTYNPKVSVLIPAWNEEVGIAQTIYSILQSSYRNLEVVVVNDGSTDNTHAIIRDLKKNLTLSDKKKITYIKQKNSGKGVALNKAVRASSGSIVLTVDADSAIEKDAIKNLVTYFGDPNIEAVVGNVKVTNTTSLAGQMQQIEYLFSFYNKRAHAVLGAEYIFGGACAAFRKSVFKKIGYFDEINKTEDIEMSLRTRFNGIHCTYAEDVVCYTEGASRFSDLAKQRLRWKKGRFDVFWNYRNMFFSRKKGVNKILTWIILPLSLLTEIQLLLEPIAIGLFVWYTLISGDYTSVAVAITFVFLGYLVFGLFNGKKIHYGLLISFPFTWAIFYALIWIEYYALIKSILMLIGRQEIVWQNWNRTGLAETK